MVSERPLLIFTNDDGIQSPGLWGVVNAFNGLGDLLVVAPQDQQSGMARSMPGYSSGALYPYDAPEHLRDCTAYAVDGTPAQAVQHAILELCDRKPALVVSGANYGDNTGNGVTISGTVGAALEGASLGVRSIAISQQTPFDMHLTYSDNVDFSPAGHFARYFGEWLISHQALPDDVDVLKIDVPWEATNNTGWQVTRVSRRRVYWPTRPERAVGDTRGKLGYRYNTDPARAEPDSDVHVLMHLKKVSVTPMSLDMTARTDLYRLQQILMGEVEYGR